MTLASLLRRLLASDRELAARDLQQESASLGASQADRVVAGERTTLVGVLQSVAFRPGITGRAVEAELFDGTAVVRLVWLGRRSIGGVEAGRPVTVRGRVVIGQDGIPTMFNPRYELAPRTS